MRVVGAVLILLAIAAAVTAVSARRRPPPLRRLVVAVSPQMLSAGIYHARDRGDFRAEGLDVELLPFDTGREAIEAVGAGRAELGTAAETPIMHHLIAGRPLAVLATIGEATGELSVIARRSRGIASAADFNGRRVGVTAGTNAEYFLHNLLEVTGIPSATVAVLDLPPAAMADALAAGEVDAVVLWGPWVRTAQAALGGDAVVFTSSELYRFTWNVVADPAAVARDADTPARFLRALGRASADLSRHPAALAALAATILPAPAPAEELRRYRYRLTLDQSLLLMLEQQARWALHAERGRPLPNLLDAFDPRPLRRVDPDAVTLITAR